MKAKFALFAIDPSLVSLGYARMDIDGYPRCAGILKQKSDSSVDYHTRAMRMASELDKLIYVSSSEVVEGFVVIIESQASWSSGKGLHSKNKGSIQRLYFLTGCIVGMAMSNPRVVSTWCVEPQLWKGQAPKDVMKRRAKYYVEKYDLDYPDKMPHDASEALLLGKFATKKLYQGATNIEFRKPLVRCTTTDGNEFIYNKRFIHNSQLIR